MSKPFWALSLDESFERLGFEKFQNIENMPTTLNATQYMTWFETLQNKDYKNFFALGREFNNQNLTFNERIFTLSWLITACETNFDLESRTGLLMTLKKLAQLDMGFYGDCMILYFDGVTNYYDRDYTAAEAKFKSALKLFETMNDYRSVANCYLYLAYVEQMRLNNAESKRYIKLCVDICSRRNYYKIKNRALDIYLEISSDTQSSSYREGFKSTTRMEDLIELISSAIEQKDVQLARLFIQQAECVRRQKGYNRQQFNLFKYLVQINFLQGPSRHRLAYQQLETMKDSSLFLETLTWMIENNIPVRNTEMKRREKLVSSFRKNKSSISG